MTHEPENLTVAAWVHVRNRQLLVVRPHFADVWFLPGGLPDTGESLAETAARETEEETGIKLHAEDLSQLISVSARAWGRPGTVRLICFVGEADIDQQPEPRDEIAEIGWLTSADREKCAEALRLVVDHLQHKRIID